MKWERKHRKLAKIKRKWEVKEDRIKKRIKWKSKLRRNLAFKEIRKEWEL